MFWRSSPRELAWEAEAARARIKRRQQERIADGWLVAALMRQKRLPALAALYGETTVRKPQTWKEMKSAMKVITGHG